MPEIKKVVTDDDIGGGLAVVGGKLVVDVDGTTVVIEAGKLVAKQGVELHVTNVGADKDTGKFVITVSAADGSNSTTVETTLADLLALSKTADNLAVANDDGLYVGRAAVVSAAKAAADVEFQSLGGETLGYGFSTNQ